MASQANRAINRCCALHAAIRSTNGTGRLFRSGSADKDLQPTRNEGMVPEAAGRLTQGAYPAVGKDVAMGELILLRHAETEWSRDGSHTGRTDLPLTAAGEAAAQALKPALARFRIVAAVTSPLRPAERTAELLGR